MFDYDWFSHNTGIWTTYLSRYAGAKGLTFVEIGSWEGRSAVWLLENIVVTSSSTLHCIDPWASPNGAVIESHFDLNISLASTNSGARVIKHKGHSIDILPSFSVSSADVVYIDGSHIAKDVLSDLILSWRILKTSGLLICDDYELDQEVEFDSSGNGVYKLASPINRPRMAIDAFLACFDGAYEVLHKEWQLMLRKK